ncbi:hypothetical protein NGA_0716900, partial [Nannochloropsis gaditana CCMP526]|uniref:uncharacterized protein n=1 Tax=Nannochloropsis gaditana (strain CCMP526) TaxID=1093141 RepID=UPI00029F57D6
MLRPANSRGEGEVHDQEVCRASDGTAHGQLSVGGRRKEGRKRERGTARGRKKRQTSKNHNAVIFFEHFSLSCCSALAPLSKINSPSRTCRASLPTWAPFSLDRTITTSVFSPSKIAIRRRYRHGNDPSLSSYESLVPSTRQAPHPQGFCFSSSFPRSRPPFPSS